MGTFVTVSVLLAMIVFGVIVIQLFTASHDDRMETLTFRPYPAVAVLAMAPHGEVNPLQGGSRSRPRR
ncbi:hypothetical protein ACWCYL_30160 [Streptomyces sp. 900105755]|uniref:hypothetical protein n=1 Tax=Streptomyces sp. 900105755 TaxID=3154389 RepID=UPI00331CEE2E